MEMHSMVSLVRKLGKALLLRFDEVHNVDEDHKVRYKEARGPILILSFFFISVSLTEKKSQVFTMVLNKILVWACLYRLIASQFPPTPEGVTVIQSRIQPGVSISYKEVSNIYQQLGLIIIN
jgi:hypothetical protein